MIHGAEQVAVHPGREGVQVPDPYFGGEGPARAGCIHCGGCMVGCRYNAKNTLVKNYLYLAEKWGAEVEAEVDELLDGLLGVLRVHARVAGAVQNFAVEFTV